MEENLEEPSRRTKRSITSKKTTKQSEVPSNFIMLLPQLKRLGLASVIENGHVFA